MRKQLERLIDIKKEINPKIKRGYSKLAGLSFAGSLGIASTLPTLYSNLSNLNNVDKFGVYYTTIILTGIAITLPIIGVFCLKEAYKKSKELAKQNITFEFNELQYTPINNILN